MRNLSISALITAACLLTVSCDTVDSDRIPPVNVNIAFSTIGDWELYGVSGAGMYRFFIESERQPAGFPYKGLEGTGYGGLLLIADPMGQNLVYDLACPVCIPTVSRIVSDTEAATAGVFKCNRCGSSYDAYAGGAPHSGQAVKDKYGLQRYHITITGGTPYAYISR